MAKSRRIDLDELERRANRALTGLRWFDPEDLPPSHRNAAGFRALLQGLAGELPSAIANGKPFREAVRAVEALHAGRQLADTAARLYHDPRVRSIVGDNEATMLHYWNNPEQLMSILAKHSVEFPKSYQDNGPVAQVMAALGEYENFHETYASLESTAEAAPPAARALGPGSESARSVEQTSRPAVRSPAAGAVWVGPRPRPPVKPAPSSGSFEKASDKSNREWAQAVAAYEQRHPPEEAATTSSSGRAQQLPSPPRSAAEKSNAEWTAAISAYERRHPVEPEDDPNALLPASYFGEEERDNNAQDSNSPA